MNNRIILTAILVILACACAWAGGPQTTVTFNDIQGTVLVENGGTGQTASSAALTALGGLHANVPVAIASGGTGATTAADSRTALGIGNHNLISVDGSGIATIYGVVASQASPTNPPILTMTSNGKMACYDAIGYGSFHKSIHATSGSAATTTMAVVTLGQDSDSCAITIRVTGVDTVNTGSECWKGLLAFHNVGGVISCVATSTVLTQDMVVVDMDDPIVTLTPDGTSVSIQMYMSETYSRYAVDMAISAQGMDGITH